LHDAWIASASAFARHSSNIVSPFQPKGKVWFIRRRRLRSICRYIESITLLRKQHRIAGIPVAQEQHMNILKTRRDLLVVGGLSLFASAVSLPIAEAKNQPLTEREAVNIKVVKQFLKDCSKNPFDAEKLVATYFDPNASVRWTDDSPPAMGAAAAIAAVKAMMPAGSWVEIQLLDIFAKGQLVATSRIDVFKVPGKPDTSIPIAGVHILKDGRFIEYADYVVK
jgi:limonene-1,2-epoxide hydrolase